MAVENPYGYGMHVVLSGATGAGKTDIKNAVEKQGVSRIVTATTRSKRTGERNEVDYLFYERDTFERDDQSGLFIETTEYGGNLYGTPKSALLPLLSGTHLITSTEIRGAAEFPHRIQKAFDPDTARAILSRTRIVLIGVEDLQTAKNRYLGREEKNGQKAAQADRNTVRKRLREDLESWHDYKHRFDTIVINKTGEFDQAVAEVMKLFTS